MTETGIMTTNAGVKAKAGAYANGTAVGETNTNLYIHMAEGVINSLSKFNWCDIYAGLDTDVIYMLDDCASNLAAMYAIQYDMSGFSSLAEAQTMLNVLRDGFERDIKALQDKDVYDFIINA